MRERVREKRWLSPFPVFLDGVEDPNETPYDPEEHGICSHCAVKLWEIAQRGLSFDLRGSTAVVKLAGTPEAGLPRVSLN